MAGLADNLAFGYYAATYGGSNLGITESPKEIIPRPEWRPMLSDRYGDTIIDGIYRGANVSVLMTFQEWKSAVTTAIWPWGSFGTLGTIGRRCTELAGALVLTALTGTPAATVGPTTITATLALISPANDIRILLGNDYRNIPVLFHLFPDANGAFWT